MIMNAKKIISEIETHLGKSNKEYYSDFYIGITNDIDRRLFTEHNVPCSGHWYIYRPADSKAIAQEVEEHFLDLGMQGDTGGGTEDTTIVYCYEISSNTEE
jgi:hypothetical protein